MIEGNVSSQKFKRPVPINKTNYDEYKNNDYFEGGSEDEDSKSNLYNQGNTQRHPGDDKNNQSSELEISDFEKHSSDAETRYVSFL